MSEAIILTNDIKTETQVINQIVNRYVNVTYKLQTEIIDENTNYSIPNHHGNIYVRIFGGGGAGRYSRTMDPEHTATAGGGGGLLSGRGAKGGTYGGGGTPGGYGGTYGGRDGRNGTNTSTWTNVFHDGNRYFRGWGISP